MHFRCLYNTHGSLDTKASHFLRELSGVTARFLRSCWEPNGDFPITVKPSVHLLLINVCWACVHVVYKSNHSRLNLTELEYMFNRRKKRILLHLTHTGIDQVHFSMYTLYKGHLFIFWCESRMTGKIGPFLGDQVTWYYVLPSKVQQTLIIRAGICKTYRK